MSEGSVVFRFDEQEFRIEGVKLWLSSVESPIADWSFGGAGGLWLCGTADPSPRGIWDGHESRFEVDRGAFDDALLTLVNKHAKFHPVDNPLLLQVRREGQLLCVEMSTELDWDDYLATEKPPDYRRHKVSLVGKVGVGYTP